MRDALFVIAAGLLVLACGSAEETPAEEVSENCDTLSVLCTIGEMMGDSVYVFGEITSAEPVAGGVAVLDIHSCRISFFNHEGEYLRSVGGHGEGPGEFLLPIDFACLDHGRIAVADLMGRKIDILSPDGELLNTLSTDFQMLPYRMEALSDSTFMVYSYTTEPLGESTSMGFQVELWDTSGFRMELWSYRENFQGNDFDFAPGYLACCAGNSQVYISQLIQDEFLIECYSAEGSLNSQITGESTAVQADSADIGYDEQYAFVGFTAGDTYIEIESRPLELRPQVGAMGVDNLGRLWVRKGTTDSEEWLLYSSEGEYMTEGTITGVEEPGRLRYVINSQGAVAWAPYTEDYPRLYVLSGSW